MRIHSRELLYVPNLLTYLRIFLIPLIYLYLLEKKWALAAGLGVIAMLSDILDGIVARKRQENSDLGKILDPLTDKLAIAVFALYAVWQAGFPLWAAGLIIGRDVIILWAGIIFSRRTREIPVSNFLGKITALCWGILLLVYVVNWEAGKIPFLVLSVGLLGASLVSYIIRLVKTLRTT